MSAENIIDQAIEHHIKRQLDQALTLYLQALQKNLQTPGAAPLISAILRTHFELALTLMKVGRDKEAILSFQRVLAIQPDESVAHAYTGAETIPARPASLYITRYYDNYAASYDQKLVNSLNYQCPQIILAALKKHCRVKVDILDLGCGTGLCGQAVRPLAKRLDGVDLSPRMLAKAKQRNIYDELEVADIYPFLEKKAGRYDAIVADGVFEHIGDPLYVFQAAFRALKDGGFFIFTAEDNPTQELSVNSSGYYMHARTYLEKRATQYGFGVRSLESVEIRIDNGTPVQGLCTVLCKPL